MFQKCWIGVVRFVDANKWLLLSRDSAAALCLDLLSAKIVDKKYHYADSQRQQIVMHI